MSSAARLVSSLESSEGLPTTTVETEDEVLAVCDEKTSEDERELGVDVPLELEAKINEELLLNEDVMEELMLEMSELVMLEVKLADEVVLTNPGGVGRFTAELATVVVMADVEPRVTTVEVLVKVTVVDVELGPDTELGDIVAEDETPLEIVRVTVEPETVLCRAVEGVAEFAGEVGDKLPLDVGDITVDVTRDEVTTEGTVGRVGAEIELDQVVAKDDASGGLGTGELVEDRCIPEVADGLGKDTVNRVDSAEEPAGAEVGTPEELDTVEDVPRELPEETGTLTEEADDGTFEGPLEVPAGEEFRVLIDDTGRKSDPETEAVIGALDCTLGGTDEDAPGANADEMSTELPGEPELCSVFVMALVGALPDDRPKLCVFCGDSRDVDGLPRV